MSRPASGPAESFSAKPGVGPKRRPKARITLRSIVRIGAFWLTFVVMYSVVKGEVPLVVGWPEPSRTLLTIHLTWKPRARIRALQEVGWLDPECGAVARTVAGWLDSEDYWASAMVGLMAFTPQARAEGLDGALPKLRDAKAKERVASMLFLTAYLDDMPELGTKARRLLRDLGVRGQRRLRMWQATEECLSEGRRHSSPPVPTKEPLLK